MTPSQPSPLVRPWSPPPSFAAQTGRRWDPGSACGNVVKSLRNKVSLPEGRVVAVMAGPCRLRLSPPISWSTWSALSLCLVGRFQWSREAKWTKLFHASVFRFLLRPLMFGQLLIRWKIRSSQICGSHPTHFGAFFFRAETCF